MTSKNSHCVYGTGLLALDLIFGPEDEQPTRWFAGGTCGNVLAILSYLGWDSFPITRLNGDVASQVVQRDLNKVGVKLDFANLAPQAPTPIVVHRIKRTSKDGKTHCFSNHCPFCRSRLPSFRAIRNDTAQTALSHWIPPTVFFLDRASRGMITLAEAAAESGALVVFEPSTRMNSQYMLEALRIAHIVKYADERFPQPLNALELSESIYIEIHTLGSHGFRYRTRLANHTSDWISRPALQPKNIVDSAGAGDWFTAVLISEFPDGLEDLRGLNISRLEAIFEHANAAAAWNCLFEGARTSMYLMPQETLRAKIQNLQEGRTRESFTFGEDGSDTKETDDFPTCPVCTS
ncbi:MAG: carbohydrate kinase [Gammaproteobacteria bacterium]|nr:carbohydrate kinase [Gammaproteobacteria bacterium]MYF01746.1 carbohydrate kinase [Gammaproteobacteria bacterium]MYI76327.1 carbohydrate kinase [Gammaproteobacteria bacterium]